MADALDAYLAQERDAPFAWGQDNGDCLLFAAGWWTIATGVDPLADLRGGWDDEASAMSLLAALGGTEQALRERLGPPRNDEPVRGDVGLIETSFGLSGAIRTGRLWAVRRAPLAGREDAGGLVYLRYPALRHWRPGD